MIIMTKMIHIAMIVLIMLTVPLTAAGMVGVYVVALHVMAPQAKTFKPPVHHIAQVKLTAT